MQLHRGHLIYRILLGIGFVALSLQGWLAVAGTAVHQIRIEPLAPYFSPNSVSVTSGTIIRWVNDTHEIHTIIADECTIKSSCPFNSGVIRPHDSYDFSRLPPGRYSYHCGLHPFMRGTISVLHPKSNNSSTTSI